MLFLTYRFEDKLRLGVVEDDCVIDLASVPGAPAAFPETLPDLIRRGEIGVAEAKEALARAESVLGPQTWRRRLAEVEVVAPLQTLNKNIFCVGRNYKAHLEEGIRASGGPPQPLPSFPEFFTKPPTALAGPFDPIPLHADVTAMLDYEVELGVVIGRPGRNIPRAQAWEHVFGFLAINDVTARDLQRRHGQWFKGKALDGCCVTGPWLVHRSAIADPADLVLRLWVNGELRQKARAADMIFDIPTLIEQLSEGLTLEPGDIIATGTPDGVGYARTPPQFLKAGDVVRAEIDELGAQVNRVSM